MADVSSTKGAALASSFDELHAAERRFGHIFLGTEFFVVVAREPESPFGLEVLFERNERAQPFTTSHPMLGMVHWAFFDGAVAERWHERVPLPNKCAIPVDGKELLRQARAVNADALVIDPAGVGLVIERWRFDVIEEQGTVSDERAPISVPTGGPDDADFEITR